MFSYCITLTFRDKVNFDTASTYKSEFIRRIDKLNKSQGFKSPSVSVNYLYHNGFYTWFVRLDYLGISCPNITNDDINDLWGHGLTKIHLLTGENGEVLKNAW